jgi:hypothetical protein
MKAAIFTVIDFYRDEQGNRRIHLHYVAATSSAEAQAVLHDDRNITPTEAYITTDEYVGLTQNNAIAAYASNMGRDGIITDFEHGAWIKTMTNPSYDGYDSYPATYRKI